MEETLYIAGVEAEFIDTADKHARSFYSLKFKPEIDSPELHHRSVGLCSSRTGIEPQLLLNSPARLLYVGLDSSLFIVSALAAPIKRLELGSPFYWMSQFGSLDAILVVHEIGLLWIDTEGGIVWRHDTEIISSIALPTPHTIEVRLLDGGQTTLDMKTGRLAGGAPLTR